MGSPADAAAVQAILAPLMEKQDENMRKAMDEARESTIKSVQAMIQMLQNEREAEKLEKEVRKKDKERDGGFKDKGKKYLDHKASRIARSIQEERPNGLSGPSI